MLQIATGRFFGSGKVNSQEFDAVLYSNFSWIQPIAAAVAELRPADSRGTRISSFVLRYTARYQPYPGDILIMPSGDQAAEQFRLLAGLWFEAFFHPDRYHVEMLCRQEPRSSTDSGVPARFVDKFFGVRRGELASVEGFTPFVNKVLAMPRKSFRLFISCLGAFFDALEAIDTNRDLAYSMFVYVLEALTQSGEEFSPVWEDFPQNTRIRLDKELSHLDSDRTEAIKRILLDNPHLKLKKRFVGFISDHLADSFFVSEARTRSPALRKNELVRALENLYDTRSGYVHSLRPIQENLRLPHWAETADVFHWDNEPFLTFSGLARLGRHVLLQFVDRQPWLDSEDYPGWRGELPGIIEGRLAPHLWLGRVDNIRPAHAIYRFNGFLSHLASHLSQSPLVLPDVRRVIEEIERIVPQAKAQDRRVWLCMYWLFHYLVSDEFRRPKWQEFLSRYGADVEECSIGLLAGCVILQCRFGWSVEECEAVYADYLRKKFRSNAINVPGIIEVAIMATIANLHLNRGSVEEFKAWVNRAILDAAGNERVQTYLKDCGEDVKAVSTAILLGLPQSAVEEGEEGEASSANAETAVADDARSWISENAYFRWVNEGCKHGHDLRHWCEAENAYAAEM